jgi:hypothetical protein
MPIKPENRLLYPPRKEWLAIRAEVLERAGHCCEWELCGIKNGTWGLRDLDGTWWSSSDFENGKVPEMIEFERDGQEMRKAYRIVLTIAHLDHDPRNNGTPGNRPNLAAWCQYHHLAYDRAHHLANGRRTRDAKKGQIAMDISTADAAQGSRE